MDSVQKIPVFVYPNSLKFYLGSRATHKQLLTLYNPYEFPVTFKVLSTAPQKYLVVDPEGSIGPQSCVDIAVRHNVPLSAHCNVTDKFRISMQDHTTKKLLGKKDIEATLLPGDGDNALSESIDNFHALPYEYTIGDQKSMQFASSRRRAMDQAPPYIALIVGLFCIAALLLPTECDNKVEDTIIPAYLHLSMNLKLVFAYVLGLVSCVVFKT